MSENSTPVVAILLTGIGSLYQSNIGHFSPSDEMAGLLWKGRTFPLDEVNDEIEEALIETVLPQRHLKPIVKIIFPEPEEEQLPPTASPLSEDIPINDDTAITAEVLAFHTCNHFSYTAKDWNNLSDEDRANLMGKFIPLVNSGECQISEPQEPTQPETKQGEDLTESDKETEPEPDKDEDSEDSEDSPVNIEDVDKSQLLDDLENLHHATFKKKYGIASDEYKKLKENT